MNKNKKRTYLSLFVIGILYIQFANAVGGIDGGSSEQPEEIILASNKDQGIKTTYCRATQYWNRNAWEIDPFYRRNGSESYSTGNYRKALAKSSIITVTLDTVIKTIQTSPFKMTLAGISNSKVLSRVFGNQETTEYSIERFVFEMDESGPFNNPSSELFSVYSGQRLDLKNIFTKKSLQYSNEALSIDRSLLKGSIQLNNNEINLSINLILNCNPDSELLK